MSDRSPRFSNAIRSVLHFSDAMNTTLQIRTGFVSGLFIAVVAAALPAVAADRDALAIAAASITQNELKVHVETLADDTFEGREAGSRGGRAAGNYVLQAMESEGLMPAGDSGTYFQSFNGSSRNILGLLEGSDPELKGQIILVSAHYDHVGYGRANNSYGPTGYIHNGADDNASGVAALLELADAMKKLPQPPKRSILFACWDGEEAGLLGSRHWTSRPTVPLSRIGLMLNMDMVGRMRNNNLEVLGARTAPGLRRLVSEANIDGPATVKFDWTLKADSDHWPFLERRIPILMLHTGLHEDYHRPSDDAPKINHDGLACTTKIAFRLVMHLADDGPLPPFRDTGRRENQQTAATLEQPIAPQAPRFGIPFKFEPGDPPRVILTGIARGTPVERAGLKTGDRLLEFQGQPIRDEGRFRLQLLAAQGETTFLIEREGIQTPQLIKVTPVGDPIRVGITWRSDDGEPGTVILTQVVYGSAADAAGLKVGDRIYSIGGRPFATEEDFVTLLTTVPNPLNMELERDGKLHAATLHVLDEPPPAE
jgi:hypothetical protein